MLESYQAFLQNVESQQEQARALLTSKGVKEIQFSRGTYQVQVVDTSGTYWVFLQYDDEGVALKDGFCSCESSKTCVHMVAAFFAVMGGDKEPLHRRFARSLWCCLGQVLADEFGWQYPALEFVTTGHYVISSPDGETLLSLQGKGDGIARLAAFIERREVLTEETSLKFSNWPTEEMTRWREGYPSQELRYELSIWNDLAKWLFMLQEDGMPYTLTFDYDAHMVPCRFKVSFDVVYLSCTLSLEQLTAIIPYLNTVKSPLQVYDDEEERVEKIAYDEKTRALHIATRALLNISSYLPKADEQHQMIGPWRYIPKQGFSLSHRPEFLEKEHIPYEEIPEILDDHASIVQRHLQGCNLHERPTPLSYHLSFDAYWNLHLSPYLFHRGDLSQGGSWLLQGWAYLHDDGFYKILESSLDSDLRDVKEEEVAAFVTQHRAFLAHQEGFATYLSTLGRSLKYLVDKEEGILFTSGEEALAQTLATHDFGSWLYLEGHGFYPAEAWARRGGIKGGQVIPPSKVAKFIRDHREDLESIPGFFADRCPILKAGLEISLQQDNTIHVTPKYLFAEGVDAGKAWVCEYYVYLPDEGFYELPMSLRLPTRYLQPVERRPEDLEFFLTYELKGLRDLAIYLDPRLCLAEGLSLSASKIQALSPGHVAVAFSYENSKGHIDAFDIWQGAQRHQRYLFTAIGLIDLHEAPFLWLRQISPKKVDKEGGLFHLTTFELLRLTTTAPDLSGQGAQAPLAIEAVWEKLSALPHFQSPPPPSTEGFVSDLRPYQEVGFSWLWFLYHNGLSGLLCDDMGLGKTHQAMALISAIANDSTSCTPTYLIVCPTSVIYHWADKLEKHLPDLPVTIFYGAGRSLQDFTNKGGILITSYGVLRSEKALIATIPITLAIYDEVQVAKNHHSQVYRALASLSPQMALGLTGTPIENNLRELKALFDIVLPGYMPSESRFRELFILPIEREKSAEHRALLAKWIKPFTLRRKKADVLLELPEKTEEVAHCGLSPQQQEMYTAALAQSRPALLAALNDPSSEIPYLHIFSILTHLKRICDHPAVFLKEPLHYHHYESGKWDLFCELLHEARDSEQKVVVFSQYLDMLTIFELYMKKHDIGYAIVRGDTQNRAEQLRRFQEDPRCEVFIGSLQAVGLGVDLTAASVVIHYDRWWNAARENQATDRVHRIGQQRGVQVFKMVTRGTFEETIDALITEKGTLLEDVVGTDPQHEIKRFSREDLLSLLKGLAAP